jgi:hypothetical protein
MKTMILASILALTVLGLTIQEANACQFCKMHSDGWHCVPCLPLFGPPKACQAKCANAKTAKQAEACLNKACPK